LDLPNRSKQIIALGKSYYGEVKLEIGELSMHEVGVELVAAEQKDGRQVIREKHDFIQRWLNLCPLVTLVTFLTLITEKRTISLQPFYQSKVLAMGQELRGGRG